MIAVAGNKTRDKLTEQVKAAADKLGAAVLAALAIAVAAIALAAGALLVSARALRKVTA